MRGVETARMALHGPPIESTSLEPSMEVFNLVAGIASILGLLVAIVTLIIAARVRTLLKKLRSRLVRRIRIQEIRAGLTKEIRPLSSAIGGNQADSAMTIVHRIAADLQQLGKHASPELSIAIKSADAIIQRLTAISPPLRTALLHELRDAVVHVIKQAENIERDLAWSDSNE